MSQTSNRTRRSASGRSRSSSRSRSTRPPITGKRSSVKAAAQRQVNLRGAVNSRNLKRVKTPRKASRMVLVIVLCIVIAIAGAAALFSQTDTAKYAACEQYRPVVQQACKDCNLDTEWVDCLLAAMVVESGGDKNVKSVLNVGGDIMQAAEGAYGWIVMNGWPERGISAIMLLANYLLENGLCNQQEREFLELVQSLVSDTTGAGVGIATADEYFGPLTVVGGTIRKEGGRLVQTMDSRWPTSITAEEITAALTKLTDNIGATFENTLLMVPFLVKPDDPEIQVLQDAFQFVTGDTEHKPFTIGGGTYAREFKKGASFGVNMPWIENPDWVGGEHGPDEGVSEELLKTSFKIYVLALAELQGLEIQ